MRLLHGICLFLLFALGNEFVFSEIYITELFLFSFSIIIKDELLYSRLEEVNISRFLEILG